MKFDELINNLMPHVNDASDLPCVIWRSKGEWNLDYIDLPPDKAKAYFEEIKSNDSFALSVKGSDFSRGSYSTVCDMVLSARLHTEFESIRMDDKSHLHDFINFLDENMSGLSNDAVEFLTSLDRPFASLNQLNYLLCYKDGDFKENNWKEVIEQIEIHAINKSKFILSAAVADGEGKEFRAFINLPIPMEEIKKALMTDNVDKYGVNDIFCGTMSLIMGSIGYPGNDTTLSELNYIAEQLSKLTPDERDKISAFYEVPYTNEVRTAKHVMDAIENRDVFILDTSMKSYEDVGNKWIDAAMENSQPAIDRLTSSGDESDKSFMRFVNLLHDNFDIAAYGRKICEENDMHITSKGIVSVDWSAFVHRDNRDIPLDAVEFFPPPDKAKPSILKQVEDNIKKIAETGKSEPGKGKGKNNVDISD